MFCNAKLLSVLVTCHVTGITHTNQFVWMHKGMHTSFCLHKFVWVWRLGSLHEFNLLNDEAEFDVVLYSCSCFLHSAKMFLVSCIKQNSKSACVAVCCEKASNEFWFNRWSQISFIPSRLLLRFMLRWTPLGCMLHVLAWFLLCSDHVCSFWHSNVRYVFFVCV